MSAAKLSSHEVALWIDEVCDEFDNRWQAGGFPKVGESIPPDAEERGVLLAMLRELLAIDMEYRWSSHFKSISSGKRRPWLEDYILDFPTLSTSPSTVLHLMQSEYRIRQVWGDRPSLATYRQRFEKMEDSVESSLHQVLNNLVACEIKVFQDGSLVLSEEMLRPVSVGRQRSNDLPPVSFEREDRSDRLVIAPSNDRGLSREHLRMELVAVDRLVIANRSDSVEVYVGENAMKLLPGEIQSLVPPISVTIGDTVIRVSTTSKIPDLNIHSAPA